MAQIAKLAQPNHTATQQRSNNTAKAGIAVGRGLMEQQEIGSITQAHTAQVTISKLSPKGEGIAFYKGLELYVPQTIVGEVLLVSIGELFVAGSKRCPATVLEVVTPSPDRVVANADASGTDSDSGSGSGCFYAAVCGGCQLRHLKYEAQLRLKKAAISEALEAVKQQLPSKLQKAFVSADILRDVVPCTEQPCRFKSIRYFGHGADNQLTLGFYAARSHQVVAIEACPQEPPRLNELSQSLLTLCSELGLSCYDEEAATALAAKAKAKAKADSKKGKKAKAQAQTQAQTTGVDLAPTPTSATNTDSASAPAFGLRALLWRSGDEGQVLGCLTYSGKMPDEVKEQLKSWAAREGISSFYVGRNDRFGNAVQPTSLELLIGVEYISKRLLGLEFAVYVPTFLQVNYAICEQLYSAAIAHCCALDTVDSNKIAGRAFDLCCGVGTMTLALAKHFSAVTGVEIVPEAIAAAKDNAARNGIANVSFIADDLRKALPQLLSAPNELPLKAIIADPARVGLGEENAKLLSKLKGPLKLSFIFCSLTALKRDLPVLLQGGFRVDYVQGFDMFPHSQHVETLVLLTKENSSI